MDAAKFKLQNDENLRAELERRRHLNDMWFVCDTEIQPIHAAGDVLLRYLNDSQTS